MLTIMSSNSSTADNEAKMWRRRWAGDGVRARGHQRHERVAKINNFRLIMSKFGCQTNTGNGVQTVKTTNSNNNNINKTMLQHNNMKAICNKRNRNMN